MDKNIHLILDEDKKVYEQEQNHLLKTILDLRFFNPWQLKTTFKDNRSLQLDSGLELYITNECNQHCQYCYLTKYPKLYPEECKSHETILNNLRILYDYLLARSMYIPQLDLFSGEIWHTEFGWQILDITYEYIQRGLIIGRIDLPSNCSFLDDDVIFAKIQNYVDSFMSVGTILSISISIDGKYIDNMGRSRDDKSQKYTDEFYDRVFIFAKHNGFNFHPMISAKNIHLWPENMKWWIKKCDEYDINFTHSVMMLEVRNNDWTEETIDLYCNFVEQLADYFLNHDCKGNVIKFANAVVGARLQPGDPTSGTAYIPWVLGDNRDYRGCTVSNLLTVRLGDLAICPCHRQAYDKYLYGKFKVEDNCIIDIEAINPYMAIKILMGSDYSNFHKCDACIYNHYCLKGCFGSQLETYGDPFFPIECVCQLLQRKYDTVLQYYKKLNIYEYYLTFNSNEPGINRVVALLELKQIWEANKDGMSSQCTNTAGTNGSNV